MKNVLSIFINDLVSIAKHFFAFVIAIAICVIPALYAWFNIFSNWDPYGGTGNISIALVTRDKGFTTEDGRYLNEGDEIVAEMAASTSINWVPTDYSEAIDGVRSGKYYGALVLGENLSRNMHRITEGSQLYLSAGIKHTGARTIHAGVIRFADQGRYSGSTMLFSSICWEMLSVTIWKYF